MVRRFSISAGTIERVYLNLRTERTKGHLWHRDLTPRTLANGFDNYKISADIFVQLSRALYLAEQVAGKILGSVSDEFQLPLKSLIIKKKKEYTECYLSPAY